MSETKKELRWFSIMDYEKEARYLSRMHQKGMEIQKSNNAWNLYI